ncbi:MAG TPA: VanZ family protein [Pyrinomonadaceae bacterium]|jgi:VanZ family protein
MIQIEFTRFWRGRFGRYAPLIFWIIVIFIASSETGSMSNTSRIISPLLEFLFPNISEIQLTAIHGYTRKAAHLAFYFILGALAARAFSSSLKNLLRRNWLPISFALIVAVASLDELNQSFLASRTSSIWDVLIDVCGGSTALLIWYLMTGSQNRERPAN